jgi:hypothetical protein
MKLQRRLKDRLLALVQASLLSVSGQEERASEKATQQREAQKVVTEVLLAERIGTENMIIIVIGFLHLTLTLEVGGTSLLGSLKAALGTQAEWVLAAAQI